MRKVFILVYAHWTRWSFVYLASVKNIYFCFHQVIWKCFLNFFNCCFKNRIFSIPEQVFELIVSKEKNSEFATFLPSHFSRKWGHFEKSLKPWRTHSVNLKKVSLFLLPVLLMLASQRIETVMDFSGTEKATIGDELPTKRGAAPTLIEWTILSWVSGEYWLLVVN